MASVPHPEVRLWFVPSDTITDPALLDRYAALMTPAERERGARFVFERHRREFAVTRALVRTILTQHAPHVAPEAWRFVDNRYGRPSIAPEHGVSLSFNLSHTDGAVVMAVSTIAEVGVDVEPCDRRAPLDVADSYFAPFEITALRALPEDARPARFFRYWTLKEAYIKARGMGVSLPLDQFWFDVEREPPVIGFDPRMKDDPARWRFDQRRIGDHLVALALERGGAEPLRVEARRVVPLVSDEPL